MTTKLVRCLVPVIGRRPKAGEVFALLDIHVDRDIARGLVELAPEGAREGDMLPLDPPPVAEALEATEAAPLEETKPRRGKRAAQEG